MQKARTSAAVYVFLFTDQKLWHSALSALVSKLMHRSCMRVDFCCDASCVYASAKVLSSECVPQKLVLS